MSAVEFRAWNKAQGRFCYFTVAPVIIMHDQEHIENRGMNLQHRMHGLALNREEQRAIDESDQNPNYEDTEHYTRFTDRHNVKVYEGDIVKWKSGPGPWVTGVVSWSESQAQWVKGNNQSLTSYAKSTEKIGDIHTDPELVKS